jgi:hypothetical protein
MNISYSIKIKIMNFVADELEKIKNFTKIYKKSYHQLKN